MGTSGNFAAFSLTFLMTILSMNDNPNLSSDMARIGNLVHHGGNPTKKDHTSWIKIKEYINELERKVKELSSNLNKE